MRIDGIEIEQVGEMDAQKPDTEPGNYYVTVRDGQRWGLLAGPFRDDHAAALSWVRRAIDKANDVNPWAAFYHFGTARLAYSYSKPGVLNDLLGLTPAAAAGCTDMDSDLMAIATDGGRFEPLSATEMDELCERINGGAPPGPERESR